MCRRRSDDLQLPAVFQFTKSCKQIGFVLLDKKALGIAKHCEIKLRKLAKLRMSAVPLAFPHGEIDQQIQMPDVALAEELVLEHRAERGSDRHGELERHPLIDEPLHHAQQRDVTFCHRLEQPLFFEEMLLFRMTNEGQMRV